MIGQQLGSYRIVRCLGEGGMGAVYEGQAEETGHRVAIKVLHARYTQDPEVTRRFLNEARAIGKIAHPGVVAFHEYGEAPQGAYLVMEYLEGETLRALLSRTGALGAQGVGLVTQLAEVLAAAHGQGIIHRDVKPENVMVVDGRVRLLDFGIARVLDPTTTTGTRTGMLMGTPAYMAPEQCRGLRVDDRADVYSVGVLLHEVVAGRAPFTGDLAELMAQHLYAPAPPLPPGCAPQALEVLLNRMLAKAPTDRPAMAEVAAALSWIEDGPTQVAPPGPAQQVEHISTLGQGAGQHVPAAAPGVSRRRTAVIAGAAAAALSGALLLGRPAQDEGPVAVAAAPVVAPVLAPAGRDAPDMREADLAQAPDLDTEEQAADLRPAAPRRRQAVKKTEGAHVEVKPWD